jgi:thioredoxin reductase (NADPH)
MTEARSCAQQRVAIIGAANSAGQAAVHFAGYAAHVTMLVRGPSLRKSMSHYLVEQLAGLANVEVRTSTIAVSADGEGDRLRSLRVRDTSSSGGSQGTERDTSSPGGSHGTGGAESDLDCDACFVFIGASPRTDWLEGVVKRDGRGFILAGSDVQGDVWPLARDPYPLETSVPGVFVAGDVRARSIKRVASAVGEGSMAVSLIHQYLLEA